MIGARDGAKPGALLVWLDGVDENGDQTGAVLAATGPTAEAEYKWQGRSIEDWWFDDLPPERGLRIWEGWVWHCEGGWHGEYQCDCDSEMGGEWRKPTAAELWAMGRTPGGYPGDECTTEG